MATRVGATLTFLTTVFFAILLVLQFFRKPSENVEGFIITTLSTLGFFNSSGRSNKDGSVPLGGKCKKSRQCHGSFTVCRNRKCVEE